ncbi:MAG: ABC transporter ATP-binding protein [Planctomycetota bacterium]
MKRSAGDQGLGLRLRAVRRELGGCAVIDRIDLTVPAGEFIAILGPSGCGKTTLLRLVAGLDVPDAGDVGLEVGAAAGEKGAPGDRPRCTPIAYVFQDPHLMPWRTVLGNVLLPLELHGVDRHERRTVAEEALAQVGLAAAAHLYPAQLSGGMRMRASLARALVTRPKLLLLDEPFAALDELTRHHLDEQLRELWLARGLTVLFVTHSTSEAVFLAQRTVVLSQRPARIIKDCTLELPRERASSLRTTGPFAAYVRELYEALRDGGGAP